MKKWITGNGKTIKYYQVDNMKFKLEKIIATSDTMYELTMFEDGKFQGTWVFTGSKAHAEALAEILSYTEIDEKDYDGEEDE